MEKEEEEKKRSKGFIYCFSWQQQLLLAAVMTARKGRKAPRQTDEEGILNDGQREKVRPAYSICSY